MTTPNRDLPLLTPLDPRIPRWSQERLGVRHCPLCGSADRPVLLRPDRLPVAACRSCGLWYVCALPPDEEIDAFYQGYWLGHKPRLSERYGASLLSNSRLREHDVRLIRLEALLGGLAGKTVLDVGCGCGELLAAARRRGATVIGNEVSPEACQFVQHTLGIPVVAGRLAAEKVLDSTGPVDAVFLSDVIEHPSDPFGLLAAARACLRPLGLLVIWTPNAGVLETLSSPGDWVGFRVDLEHLQYFSPRTILGLAERQAWQIEHLEALGYPDLSDIARGQRPDHRLSAFIGGVRAAARRLPPVRTVADWVRSNLEARSSLAARRGTYHLFGVLRKAQQALDEHAEKESAS